jgi:hypothetical protein
MAKRRSRGRGSAKQEVQKAIEQCKQEVAAVKTRIPRHEAAGAQDGDRTLEALRRERLRLLVVLDRLEASPVLKPPPGRFYGAPKSGVRSMGQAGSPGLGKRR